MNSPIPICAAVKDLLLCVTGVVIDTNTARGEQSVDRLSKSLTQDRPARDAFFISSCVAGGEILEELQSQLERHGSYVSSDIVTSK